MSVVFPISPIDFLGLYLGKAFVICVLARARQRRRRAHRADSALGVIESLGATAIGPEYSVMIGFVVLLAVLAGVEADRPRGPAGRMSCAVLATAAHASSPARRAYRVRRRAAARGLRCAAIRARQLPHAACHDPHDVRGPRVVVELHRRVCRLSFFRHRRIFRSRRLYGALLLTGQYVPFWASPIAAALASVIVAAIIGFPILRLRGHYFAVASLGVAEVFREVATSWTDVTGGGMGLNIPARAPDARRRDCGLLLRDVRRRACPRAS